MVSSQCGYIAILCHLNRRHYNGLRLYTHSCSIWLSRTSMTGLVGLELGSRILGFADFIVAANEVLMEAAAAPFHLGRPLNSIIIFIVVIIFFFFSPP